MTVIDRIAKFYKDWRAAIFDAKRLVHLTILQGADSRVFSNHEIWPLTFSKTFAVLQCTVNTCGDYGDWFHKLTPSL